MPNATITSTASTFGTISGTFAADQSTITGTISGVITGTLDGSVGVPGPQGSPGVGVPAGGLTAQFLQKTSGLDYATDWVTLPAYLPLAGGTMDVNATIELSDPFTGTVSEVGGYGMAVSSDSNNNLLSNFLYDRIFVKNATSQTTLKPTGVEFPDATLQTTAFTGWNNVALTGNPTAPTAGLADNDTSIATTAFVQQELASGTANARNLEVYVRNQTGSTLAAGTIVYINGATGNRPTVTPAQANNDANSAQTFGFVKTSIANNGFGFVIVRGEVENLDTSALTEGVQLYLSPTTAGAYTTTKPSAPQHLVYVGIVVRAHPTQGVILAAIQNGYELNEIHDVAISSITDGDLLSYESATTLWKNKSISTLGLATQSWVTSQGYLTSASLSGYATQSWVTSQGYITASALSPYLTSATAASTYQTLAGMSSYLTTATAASTYASLSGTNTISGTNTFSGATLTFGNSTGTSTVNIATGATTSTLAKTVNIASNGASGSNTTLNLGSSVATGHSLQVNVGSNTGTSTVSLRGTIEAPTTTAGSSNLVVANTAYVANELTSKANLASPSLTGTPLSTTAAADTNTTQIATTAFVIGQASSTTPAATGTAAIGTSKKYARADHVHANPLPTGGTTGQVLSKVDGTSYNVAWTTVASGGGTWGSITGTLSSQTDLQSALDAKLSTATAASTYAPLASPTFTGTVTIPAGASISGYLTSANAASTYQTLAGMSSYLTTATAASTYAPLASPALTGTPTAPTALTADSSTTIATTAFVKAQGYLTSAPVTSVAGRTGAVTLSNTDISGLGTMATATAADYSTTTVANGLYYPLTGNPSSFITSSALTGYALESWVTTQLGSYLTTASAASTYQTQAGMSSYLTTATAASTYLTQTNAASTYQTLSGMSSYLTTSTAASTYAPLASPSLTGVPLSTTAAADTNTTQIATTAFVVGQVGTATPLANGTAAVGTSLKYARQDHVHPSDNNVKAWVNFNGTGTVAIRASMNVTSITDNGNGTYTVNFTTALSDANYAAIVSSKDTGAGNWSTLRAVAQTTSAVAVGNRAAGGYLDSDTITVACFR